MTRAAVRGAHGVAVEEALRYVERSAAAVRRGAGGLEVQAAEGLVAAAFRHRSSRAGDPQLHTHVAIANLACGRDGRWSALDAQQSQTPMERLAAALERSEAEPLAPDHGFAHRRSQERGRSLER